MNMEEEEMSHYGGFGSGCELHGEDFLRECTMCGIEFCAACFPRSALCPDCAAQAELDADDEDEPTEEERELSLLEGFNDDEPAELLSISDIDIDVPAHKVSRAGEQISLTPLEFDLLVALARKPRQVFTRDVLLEQVWGYRHAADTRLVNVHVQRLRAKVEKDPENPDVVLTVRGVGYKAGPP